MSPLKRFGRLILVYAAAMTALAGLSAIHAEVSARRENAQWEHEIDQDDLLRSAAFAALRSIADSLPQRP